MKIVATCDTCGREFLLEQIGQDSDAPGRCPFCGARFARHYSTVLVETVRQAELAAQNFVRAFGKLQAMETGFDIDIDRAMRNVTEAVRAHEEQAVG